MQSNGVTQIVSSHNPAQLAQSADVQDAQQESSESSALKKFCYYYDPENGTRYRLGNTAITIVGSSAAGAATMYYLAPQLSSIAGQGTSIFERLVQQLDNVVLNNPMAPVAAGAALGAIGGYALIQSAYQGGLKPRTKAAIQSIMNGVIHNIESNLKAIQHHKTAIEHYNVLLKDKKPSMLLEREENQRKAAAQFRQDMEAYNHQASKVVCELSGYLNAVFDQLENPDRLPSYEEAVSGSRRQGDYQLGRAVNTFVRDSDYSRRAQQKLISKLIPYLTERELKNVKDIFHKLPPRPFFYPLQGPIEREFNKIASEKASNTREMGVIEQEVRKLTERYPLFSINAEGEVTRPPISEFSKYLRE